MDDGDLIRRVEDARRQFLERVADLRPSLLRYAARMTGSVVDGEDVVQDALARAFFALTEREPAAPLRPWLFRITHNVAVDRLRGAGYRRTEPLDEALDAVSADTPEDAVDRAETTGLALRRFLELPPAQRSTVILKDVLGHSLTEIGDTLDLSVPAVKAALHRGRGALRSAAALPAETRPPSPELVRYVALFNARDWDAIRAQLAEEVRLDLVARLTRAGPLEVGEYFTRYDLTHDWRLVPAWLDGREVAAVESEDGPYFVVLGFADGQLVSIRDYRYARWVAAEARVEPAGQQRRSPA